MAGRSVGVPVSSTQTPDRWLGCGLADGREGRTPDSPELELCNSVCRDAVLQVLSRADSLQLDVTSSLGSKSTSEHPSYFQGGYWAAFPAGGLHIGTLSPHFPLALVRSQE